MQATTIKLHAPTKKALDTLRTEEESYDTVVKRLISEQRRKTLKKELIEGYQATAAEDQELAKEWEPVTAEIDE